MRPKEFKEGRKGRAEKRRPDKTAVMNLKDERERVLLLVVDTASAYKGEQQTTTMRVSCVYCVCVSCYS